ncbi:UNVERIFIED_CONTAM: hypothetical protein Slati_1401600 [Sesamum latifolium]|uniref:Uncharacterized protein n=1 Tax=Sesamum latifolium TaxID=2727402 RepID=A0AAW2X2K6_9LAMI
MEQSKHLKHLEESFAIMSKYGMKLNLAKCTFGVREGKFLGYMLTERGIEANSEKLEAILHMLTPKSVKDIQKLAGRMTSLSSQDREKEQSKWLLQVDGSSNSTQGGAGIVLKDPQGVEFEVAVKLNFAVTSNEAEVRVATGS